MVVRGVHLHSHIYTDLYLRTHPSFYVAREGLSQVELLTAMVKMHLLLQKS
jgi:hypothetical protein